MTTNHSSLHHFWLILGKFSIFPEPSPSVVALSAAHISCSGCAATPRWHIHTCCCQKVCFVSQHSVKSVQEMPGDRPVLPVEVVCTVGGAEIHQQYCCLLLCAKRQKRNTAKALQKWPPAGLWYACFCQTCQIRPHRVDGGPMSPHYV